MSGFDTKKFLKTRFSPRTADVSVPDLKDYFPAGEKPVWKVRGLTGQEVGTARQASANRKDLGAIMDGLLGSAGEEKARAVREMMNLSGDIPEDVVKRIAYLTVGSVDPPGSEELSVFLCENFPVTFYDITNQILVLTGLGRMPGKQEPSGDQETSGPA